MRGNCDDPDVWGLTGPEAVVGATDCGSEAAATAVTFGPGCPDVAASPALHALTAKCSGIAVVGDHTTRMFGHTAATLIVDSAWIMLTIGLFVSKLGTVLGPQKKTPGIIPANVALAVSVVAVIAVIAPVRDGTCFRAYADGTVEHNGDGERARGCAGAASRSKAAGPRSGRGLGEGSFAQRSCGRGGSFAPRSEAVRLTAAAPRRVCAQH